MNEMKKIWKLALPSIVSNITVPMLALMDLSIVGHLGRTSYIAAIAIGGTIFNMIYWIFAFLRMGTTGITGQSFGAHDTRSVQLTLVRGMVMALVISAMLLLLQQPLLSLALRIMEPAADVQRWASLYFRICIWGAPAHLMAYVLNGWFIGMQNTRIPMITSISLNLMNMMCSLLMVFVFHMGVAGVAMGTVVSLYFGLIIQCICCFRIMPGDGRMQFLWSDVFARSEFVRFARINRDIFLRTLCLVAVTVYFTTAGSRQGEVILAVNSLLMQFFMLFSYFMDGLANAAEALCGKLHGGSRLDELARTIRHLFAAGCLVAFVFTLLYALGGGMLMRLFTDQQDVIAQSKSYLLWTLLVPAVSTAAFIWDGVFIGMTLTRGMLISMFTATVTFFTVWFLTAASLANHGLWIAFLSYLLMRGLVQTVYYHRVHSLAGNRAK